MLGVPDQWGHITTYLGHDLKKNVIILLRTSAMVMIYTLIKRESDYLEDKIVKT